jgi:hypothetical protein
VPPITTLVFRLSAVEAQQHLLQELSLHQGVVVRPLDSAEPPVIVVELDSAASSWEIRATVGAFDEKAIEMDAQP